MEKISLNYRHLLPDLASWLTLSGSNYLCLEQIFMVPKMFEPLKFDCILCVLDVLKGQRMTMWARKLSRIHCPSGADPEILKGGGGGVGFNFAERFDLTILPAFS